jgi:DNA-binding response OmpR family regulator
MLLSSPASTTLDHQHNQTSANRIAEQDSPPPARPNPLCNPGVLIVDDDACIRDLLSYALRHLGFEIWQASDGFDALDTYEANPGRIALVLLDVRMGGLDGPHTLRCLQHIDPKVQACFMSGDLGDYEENQLLRLGARRVFHKPFALVDIAAAVRQLVRDAAECLGDRVTNLQ